MSKKKLHTIKDITDYLPLTKNAVIKLRRSGVLNPHIKATRKGRKNYLRNRNDTCRRGHDMTDINNFYLSKIETIDIVNCV